jgi:hypothetical protein
VASSVRKSVWTLVRQPRLDMNMSLVFVAGSSPPYTVSTKFWRCPALNACARGTHAASSGATRTSRALHDCAESPSHALHHDLDLLCVSRLQHKSQCRAEEAITGPAQVVESIDVQSMTRRPDVGNGQMLDNNRGGTWCCRLTGRRDDSALGERYGLAPKAGDEGF